MLLVLLLTAGIATVSVMFDAAGTVAYSWYCCC